MASTGLRLVRVQSHHRNRLQCPWTKEFPQDYEDYELPCTKSSFDGFSKLNEHIGRYHSYKEAPSNVQITDGKSVEEDSTEMEEEMNDGGNGKRRKAKKLPNANRANQKRQKKETPPESLPLFHMMTREQESSFKAWRHDPTKKNMQDKEEKYWSLRRVLFGYENDRQFVGQCEYPIPPRSDVIKHLLNEAPEYDYLVLRHSVPPASLEPVQRDPGNIDSRLAQTFYAPAQSVPTDPFTLDNPENVGRKPSSWSLQMGTPTNDSGYVSAPMNLTTEDRAAEQGYQSQLPTSPKATYGALHLAHAHPDNSDGIAGADHLQDYEGYPAFIPDDWSVDLDDSTGTSG
ncbi:hypothetical protein GGR52DRAFT_592847 [Hypoxylon sp. FL1284]|nr:hypothetical protein GGR52DRAFT_592847 [Hypoxylon sp. FL1284]